jgi:hypothetical protein
LPRFTPPAISKRKQQFDTYFYLSLNAAEAARIKRTSSILGITAKTADLASCVGRRNKEDTPGQRRSGPTEQQLFGVTAVTKAQKEQYVVMKI